MRRTIYRLAMVARFVAGIHPAAGAVPHAEMVATATAADGLAIHGPAHRQCGAGAGRYVSFAESKRKPWTTR